MDNLFLNDFFDKFSNELEIKREIDNRHDKNLSLISLSIVDFLLDHSILSIKKPSRFRNPRLYYRIDISSYTSIETVLDKLVKKFKYYSKVEDFDSFYLNVDVSEMEDEEDFLIIKGFYRGDGIVSLELLFSKDPGVIQFSKIDSSYSVTYLLSGSLRSSIFYIMDNNLYSHDNLIFSPDLKSSNPNSSKIYPEQ